MTWWRRLRHRAEAGRVARTARSATGSAEGVKVLEFNTTVVNASHARARTGYVGARTGTAEGRNFVATAGGRSWLLACAVTRPVRSAPWVSFE